MLQDHKNIKIKHKLKSYFVHFITRTCTKSLTSVHRAWDNCAENTFSHPAIRPRYKFLVLTLFWNLKNSPMLTKGNSARNTHSILRAPLFWRLLSNLASLGREHLDPKIERKTGIKVCCRKALWIMEPLISLDLVSWAGDVFDVQYIDFFQTVWVSQEPITRAPGWV